MASKPITMNTIIANTLMDANQNSDSPYSLTDRILSMNTTAMKAADARSTCNTWTIICCLS